LEYPGVTFRKAFHGLMYDEAPPGFLLWITPPGGTRTSYTAAQARDGIRFDFSPTDPTGVGLYYVEEERTAYPGFVLNDVVPPLPRYFEVTQDDYDNGTEILFDINNYYDRPSYTLNLEKVLRPDPLVVTQFDDFGNPMTIIKEPLDLAFKIEGITEPGDPPPPPPFPSPYPPDYPGNDGYLKTILWTDLDSNHRYTLRDIPPGEYSITEVGASVPGYNGPRITLTVNGNPLQNGGTFELLPDRNINLAFRFTNRYDRIIYPPPPTVTSPQTGDTRSVVIPIIVLSFGALFITGAELYRRRTKRSRES